ncbi:hypothetical protein LEP1GSC062_0066 [Leptospira alexanderi serovar Manhao 3 str. L 60]|uniref:Uncharacterized protein n=1 Tax=Leptospira alexanderi serovar Manhao 3 str. L 60 TaxID=1049759 RepID=V6HWE1_9LEPT|nr:hypothetical protein LEP1GSC062_0066 [Leptospira alexanderi serovar Manhao 3 str. L 60]
MEAPGTLLRTSIESTGLVCSKNSFSMTIAEPGILLRSTFRFPITEMAARSDSSPLEEGRCVGFSSDCAKTPQESRKKRKIQRYEIDFCSIWL